MFKLIVLRTANRQRNAVFFVVLVATWRYNALSVLPIAETEYVLNIVVENIPDICYTVRKAVAG